MGWSVLQSAVAAGGTATAIQTYSSNVSSGTKLIAVVTLSGGVSSQTISTVKDGSGNNFTQLTHIQNNSNGGICTDVWAMDTPAGDVGTKPQITATFSAAVVASGIWIGEVSGLLAGTSGIIDGTAGTSNNGNGTFSTVGPPSYTSSASNEFLLYVYCDDGVPTTFTAPGGYTLDSNNLNNNVNDDLGVCYKNSTNGTETGSFSLSPSSFTASDGWTLTMFALKLAPAPPGSRRVSSTLPRQYVQITTRRPGRLAQPVVLPKISPASSPRRIPAIPRGRAPVKGVFAVVAPAVPKIPPAGLPRKVLWFDRAYKRTQQARLIVPAVSVPLPARAISVRRLPADTRHDKITPPPLFLQVSGPLLPPVASRPRIPQGWARPRVVAQVPVAVPHPVMQKTAARPGLTQPRSRILQLPLLRAVPLARLRARVQAGLRRTAPAQLPPPPVIVPPAVLPPRALPVRARWLQARTRPAPQLAPVTAAPVVAVLPPSVTGPRLRQLWARMRARVQVILPVPVIPAVPAVRTRSLTGIRLRQRAQQARVTAPVPQAPPAQGQRSRLTSAFRRQLQLPVQPARVIAGLRPVIRLPGWIRRPAPQQLPPPAAVVIIRQGTAALQAYSVLSAQAAAGPDLANLWLIYLAAETNANNLTERWYQVVQAGGSGWASAAYSAAYQAQLAAGEAYIRWQNAYNRINQSPPGGPQLPLSS